MKILYIGGEQSDAHGVATALRGIDQDVKVSCASVSGQPRNGSLARDLPIVVTRAVAWTRGRQQVELDDMR